ncbi:MAG TPA: menaquinone biosynthesis decarboxylase [Blastocatellia bacterium]|jgi:4-hydroxy-3-polyprenylbenzoate decarboxylase|nr:menaquinone biosynthesis decarboxylase [Blastocatellia bacterium]
MAFEDLREFIRLLEKRGELKRIRAEVDPELEITEITDRVSKQGGPALLFENVRGSDIPVLINAFGSRERMKMAFGVDDYDEITERITELTDVKSPQGLIEKIKMVPRLADIGKMFPKVVRDGPCKEKILGEGEFSLLDLPVLKCWPEDGGRFITLPLVFTKNPESGKRNCGMYRMQVYDETTTGMHWQIHKHGAQHFRNLRRSGGGRLEAAVAIGADPVTVFSAILPLPEDLDEMMIAGFLREKPVEMVKCETVDVEVPANAEIILEGYVDIDERRVEGPFGDHTGYYSLEDEFPIFHVTCVTHRRKPIYQTTIVGKPPMEDCWMGEAIERIFLPLMKRQFSEVVDYHMPFAGVFHNLMIVSIRKNYPGHARKVMNSIWSLPQAMFTKCIVVVDDDTDVRDLNEVAWRVLNNIDPERDIQFMLGPVDQLDHSSRLPNFGSKMGIDGTRKWKSEGFHRPWPKELEMSEEVRRRIDLLWPRLGL